MATNQHSHTGHIPTTNTHLTIALSSHVKRNPNTYHVRPFPTPSNISNSSICLSRESSKTMSPHLSYICSTNSSPSSTNRLEKPYCVTRFLTGALTSICSPSTKPSLATTPQISYRINRESGYLISLEER